MLCSPGTIYVFHETCRRTLDQQLVRGLSQVEDAKSAVKAREEALETASAEAAAAAEAHARRVAQDTAQLDSLRTEFR